MNDDVRKYIYGTLIVFVLFLLAWVSFVYINACGFTVTCKQGELRVDRTPIPTLIPATLPVLGTTLGEVGVSSECQVAAVDLIGAWVSADKPETDAFPFTDMNGQTCETTFEEMKPLFVEGNLWYAGSLSCVSCHSVDVTISPAQLDLSSYEGILAGSRRADADSEGTDILGDGDWKKSLLYDLISNPQTDVPGHADPISGLKIFVGVPLPNPELQGLPTLTATPSPVP